MLTQRLAASGEAALRKRELLAARERGDETTHELNGELLNLVCDDDDTTGSNDLPPAKNAHQISAYVNNALDNVRAAGFNFHDTPNTPGTSQPPTTLLSGRTQDQLDADNAKVRLGQSETDAHKSMTEQSSITLTPTHALHKPKTLLSTAPFHTTRNKSSLTSVISKLNYKPDSQSKSRSPTSRGEKPPTLDLLQRTSGEHLFANTMPSTVSPKSLV